MSAFVSVEMGREYSHESNLLPTLVFSFSGSLNLLILFALEVFYTVRTALGVFAVVFASNAEIIAIAACVLGP